ncbi:phage tail assembly protein [Cupriavidus nantongensis]|uniref:Phage tail protein n=1 Tax=Cupriavidus nantongensis TaxID=1796606 RepID=A0A142JGT2_9BURK|nr:phage tail assembly protein [Cupriavidus nantongensis]AMR77294.1 hypothetical protein A2G96_05860 [Cupriavidus nantongensis]
MATPVTETIALDEPIKRGEQVIESLTVRKPLAGALRGVSLVALCNMDVVALQTVLPRITTPTLTAADVANMDPADLLEVGTAVAGFFARKAERPPVPDSATASKTPSPTSL